MFCKGFAFDIFFSKKRTPPKTKFEPRYYRLCKLAKKQTLFDQSWLS
jgi:hypothetical protein